MGHPRDGFDFLIVSDASAPLEIETRTSRAPLRLLDVATDQVRSLRARALVSQLQRNPGTGVYLKIGNTEERIYRAANRPAMAERIADDSLLASQVLEAASISTTLRRFTQHEYELLFAHGHQVADATLSAYCSARFEQAANGKIKRDPDLRPQSAVDKLARIAEDAERFVPEQVDRDAKGTCDHSP